MPTISATGAATTTSSRRRNLAAYKYPRIVEFVDEFPLTSSGKISRRTLRARAAGEKA